MISKSITRIICRLIAVFLFVAAAHTATAQKLVDVDLLTGAASVNIPICKIGHGDVSVPISLSYAATGIKVDDSTQIVGLGWNLVAEVAITRTIKGIADDMDAENCTGSPNLKGWLKTTDIPGKVENFTIANDNNPATCTDEFSDYTYMNSNFPDNFDTEPDIFNVSLPNMSFQFVFDKDKNIRVIPYRDVKITYTTDQFGRIDAFTVIDDKGVKYVFNQAVEVREGIEEVIDPSSLDAFRRNYLFYRCLINPIVTRIAFYKWYVKTISDTKGNSVVYNYEPNEVRSGTGDLQKVDLVKYDPSTSSFYQQHLYTKRSTYYSKLLNSIWFGSADIYTKYVEFEWNTERLTRINLLWEGKAISFGYTSKFNRSGNSNEWGRFFLKTLTKNSSTTCGNEWVYKFSYYDVNETSQSCYCTTYENFINAQDYWGYYNGAGSNTDLTPPVWVYPDNPAVEKFKIAPIPGYAGNVVLLPGSNRTPTANAVGGSLYRITYPEGGVTQFEYENNDYFDKDVNGAVAGGGIRIKKLVHNDGLNTNDVTTYEYNDPLTGVTSGRATAVPSFTVAFPNLNSYADETQKVNNSTYRTHYDFSDEGKYIVYGKVTVRKTGGGKSVYEFYTAPTWGNAATGNWNETPVYLARPYSSGSEPCSPMTPSVFSNGKNVYPFPANPNYEFERGLLQKTSHYSETNALIQQIDYTYQRSHAQPVMIKALKFDDIKGVRAYAGYNILSTVGNLLATKVTKKWNAVNPIANVFTTETETYAYDGVNHKLPTMMEIQNSDGNIYRSRTRFVKDYAVTGTGDQYDQALYKLQENNNNIPVESWQSVVTGNTEKVTAAQLITYKEFVPDYSIPTWLPFEQWQFSSPEGVANFVPSDFNAGVLTKHAGYYKNSSILKYDFSGNPISITDNGKINKAYLYNTRYNLKTSEFVNAKQDEIIHSTFDYDGDLGNFWYTNESAIEPGHNSRNCYSLQAGTPLTKTIANAVTNKNIIFSCWLKDAAAAGNFTITITPSVGNAASYNMAYTVHSGWKYYELTIPKPSYPAVLTYTVAIQSTTNIKVDDILLYPENATVKTYSYILKTFVVSLERKGILLSAEGGNNGLLKQYEYDIKGRVSAVRDQDDNILEVRNYKETNSWRSFASSTLTWSNPPTTTTPVTFTNSTLLSSCELNGGYYKWNFGDGTPEVATAANTATHTYTTGGKFQVSCTAYPPGFTPMVVTTPAVTDAGAVTVPNPAPTVAVTICAAGIVERTSSGQCVLATCSGLTAVCTNTKFKVSSMTPGSLNEIDGWKWEKAPLNSNTWSTFSNAASPTITFTSTTASYKVRCTVYTIENEEGVSNEITVIRN